jgi:hypothetical protein
MEGANEAARRAVNGIIDASGGTAPYCQIWKLHEPAILAPWRAYDRERWQSGLPWDSAQLRLEEELFDALRSAAVAAVDVAASVQRYALRRLRALLDDQIRKTL